MRRGRMLARLIFLFTLAGLVLAQVGCGGSAPASDSPPPDPLPVRVQHVFIVVLENQGYDDVIGNTKDMPYLNNLATTYAYAENYYASAHPSLPNYLMLTTGETIVDGVDEHPGAVTQDNIVRHLIGAGKSWKAYEESLPSMGYTGGDEGAYQERFDPLSYFSDVRDNETQANNIVPFAQFAVDLKNHALPNYVYLGPDLYDNAHSCPQSNPNCTDDQRLAAGDNWLETNLSPLIASPDFSTSGGGLLIITFDEGVETDITNGGGHTAWIAVGPDVKKGYTSMVLYQHPSTLRLMCELLGLTSLPGEAATAPDMGEFLVAAQPQ